MVTGLQNRVLEFIAGKLAKDGVAPSYAEIGRGCGLKSKAQVHGIVLRLEQRGIIRRIPNHARAIEIVDRGTGGEFLVLAREFIRTAVVRRQTADRTTIEVDRDTWEFLIREVEDHDIRQA